MSTYLVSYLLRLVGASLFVSLSFTWGTYKKRCKCFVYGEKVNSLSVSFTRLNLYVLSKIGRLLGYSKEDSKKWPLPGSPQWLCDTKVDWTNTVCPKSEECPNLPARHEGRETTPVNIHISHYWYCMWPHIGFTMSRPKNRWVAGYLPRDTSKTSYRSTNNCSYISHMSRFWQYWSL